MDLNGKTAIVTGASAGIGRAIVAALAAQGVNQTITARNVDRLEEVAEAARSRGVRVLSLPGDATDRRHVESVVAATLAEFGAVDLLVNNAAIHTLERALTNIGVDNWDRVVATNLTAPFDFAREVVPAMRAADGGLIINIASTAAFIRDRTFSGVAYGATKAGLAAFTPEHPFRRVEPRHPRHHHLPRRDRHRHDWPPARRHLRRTPLPDHEA